MNKVERPRTFAEEWVFTRVHFTIEERSTQVWASQSKRLKELEDENARLKKMYAELSLDNVMLKDVLSKKW